MCLHLLLLFLLVTTAATFSAAQVNNATTFQSIADGETFELGFFSPGASNKRYVGIWYKKIPDMTVVWVVNRDFPLSASSGVLKVTNPGILVLVDQNNTVWSSNTSIPTQNPVARILDSGNLVVIDGNDHNVVPENFLWQSFDYPGDAAW
ncbi:hypothetical protein D8674_027403 [Pyrus ussuriensis x Pyrus communis]|uniref:Bulb-type lectin domain-containing protein n=1 Tax=Pyrus ussuriensis x Pyrus communis TaxID=2448454 RepID=A0A5N5IB55_9ROSA|nr:hypothetical protein D8674_027403 [Pyrus ussuriensis x Pyrus communis]